MPSNTPPVKPGCKGVDCASLQSDDGAFAAVLKKAREEVGHMYNHESQSAVVVVTKAYCDKVLAAFKAKAEPYWNTEKRICNAERVRARSAASLGGASQPCVLCAPPT